MSASSSLSRARQVATDIRSKGYEAAANSGRRIDDRTSKDMGELHPSWCLGILKDDKAEWEVEKAKASRPFMPFLRRRGIMARTYRAAFPATLWFENEARDATSENWVMEIHGERHKQEMTKLGEELSLKYKVNITVFVLPKERLEAITW
jgi:hypothetical protein